MVASAAVQAAMIDETDVASFNEDGYLAVEGVISPAEVAELQAVATSWVEASRSVSENTAAWRFTNGAGFRGSC